MIKEESKVYKEKLNNNSDNDPWGITLNGKTKEYIHARDTIKGMVKKGKQYSVENPWRNRY